MSHTRFEIDEAYLNLSKENIHKIFMQSVIVAKGIEEYFGSGVIEWVRLEPVTDDWDGCDI